MLNKLNNNNKNMPPGFVRAVFLAFGRSCFPIKRIFINANFPILRAFDASAFSAGVVHTATNSRATPEHSRTNNTRRATAQSTIKVFLLNSFYPGWLCLLPGIHRRESPPLFKLSFSAPSLQAEQIPQFYILAAWSTIQPDTLEKFSFVGTESVSTVHNGTIILYQLED